MFAGESSSKPSSTSCVIPIVAVSRVRARGAIALTVTPKRSSSRARTRVIDAIPVFAAAYEDCPGLLNRPESLVVLMIRP